MRKQVSKSSLLLPAMLAMACVSAAYAEDEDVITYRQLIMKQLDAGSAALGMMVSGQIPPDSLGQQTRALAANAKMALKSFEPKVSGGEAKSEVWTKWVDFSMRMEQFVKKADEMAKAGDAGNVSQVTELMVDALPCKQCHDVYRMKKK